MTKVINERNENPFQWNQLYQSARFRLCLIVIANFNPIYFGTTSAKIPLLLFSSHWTYFPTNNFWNYRDSIHERITSRLFVLNWLYSIEPQLSRNFSSLNNTKFAFWMRSIEKYISGRLIHIDITNSSESNLTSSSENCQLIFDLITIWTGSVIGMKYYVSHYSSARYWN